MIPTEVSADELRASSRQLTTVAEQTDATLQGFHAQIGALGRPWGNDDLGSAIGLIYEGVLALAMNCFGSNLDTLDGYAERLSFAADGYEATDTASAERLEAINAGITAIPMP